MALKQYHSGPGADILVFEKARGDTPAEKFIDELDAAERRRIVRYIAEYAERGSIRNKEHFRHEGEGIYVFKGNQARVACFQVHIRGKRTLILTHGFTKKRDDMPPEQFRRAVAIRQQLNI